YRWLVPYDRIRPWVRCAPRTHHARPHHGHDRLRPWKPAWPPYAREDIAMRCWHPTVTGVMIAALLSASLAACTGNSPPPSPGLTNQIAQRCTKTGPIVFVVSGRQDNPSPRLT